MHTCAQYNCYVIQSYNITNLHIVFDNAVIVSDDVIVDTEFFEVSYNNNRLSLYISQYHYNNNLQMFEKL